MRYPRIAAPVGKLAVWLGITLGCLLFSSRLSAQEPKPRLTFLGHTENVCCVAFSPDGKTLASGGNDDTIRFWDVASGKERAIVKKAAEYGVASVAFSPDGKTLASGTGSNKIKLWDVGTRKATTLLDDDSEYARPMVVFSLDGKTLASGGRCISEIKVYDLATGKNTTTLKGHDSYGVRAMAFTPDGKALASVGWQDGIKLWDVSTGKEKPATLKKADKERIEKLIGNLASEKFLERDKAARELEAIGPMACDLLKQAANHEDAEIRRRAAGLVDLLEEQAVTADSVCSAAFSPDGKTLATGGGDNHSVKLWEVATGKVQTSLKGHTGTVWALVFSPDGKTLATGNEDKTIKLWDVAKGKELATLKGHTDEVKSLAYSADGKILASGSKDNTIKLWDVAKAK